MPQGGVRVEGLNEKVRQLQSLGLELDDLKSAFGKIAETAVARVRSYVPTRSGRLASSLRGNKAKNKAVVRAGRATVPYAGAINYGWHARNIEPAAYMQKGDEDMRPIAVEKLESEIESAIRRKGLR